MPLTRLEMATEVLDNLGRVSTAQTRSGSSYSDLAVRWLNRAQRQLARKYDMLFKTSTASTIASTQNYAFPSNIRTVFSIRLEDGLESVKLVCIAPWDFDRLVPKPDEQTTGRPDYYIPYKASNEFELFRIPDATYTLRMRHSVWPTDLAADDSTSDYHVANIDVDDVLIALATSYGFKMIQELVDSSAWRKDAWELAAEIYKSETPSFPDWAPVMQGFSLRTPQVIGEYYNNPFVGEDP